MEYIYKMKQAIVKFGPNRETPERYTTNLNKNDHFHYWEVVVFIIVRILFPSNLL